MAPAGAGFTRSRIFCFYSKEGLYMNDNMLHRYRFLSGFCFDLVELDLYCYPWLPCHPKRVRVALVSIRKKNAASGGGFSGRF